MVPDGIVIRQAAISRTKLAPRTVCGNATLTMLPEDASERTAYDGRQRGANLIQRV
jgi:hypothetical protein